MEYDVPLKLDSATKKIQALAKARQAATRRRRAAAAAALAPVTTAVSRRGPPRPQGSVLGDHFDDSLRLRFGMPERDDNPSDNIYPVCKLDPHSLTPRRSVCPPLSFGVPLSHSR